MKIKTSLMESNFCKIVLFFFCLLVFPLPKVSFAANYHIHPIEQGWVDSAMPDTCFYPDVPGMYVYNDGGVQHIGYAKYDLSSISDSETIVTINLKGWPATISQYYGPFQINIYHVSNDSWNQNSLTWNNQPGFDSLLGSTIFTTDVVDTIWDLSGYDYSLDLQDNYLSIAMVVPNQTVTGLAWGSPSINIETAPVITVNPYSDEFVIMVGSGKDSSTGKLFYIPIYPDGTFGDVSEVIDLGYRSGAGVADFDNDGNLDFVAGAIVEQGPDGSFADFYLFKNIGNGSFEQYLIASHVDAGGYSDNRVGTFAVADFNGDGYKDFVVPIYRSDHVYLFINNGDRTFTLKDEIPSLANPFDAKEGDFDEDGNMDFVVTDYFNERVYLYKGDGNGGFTEEYLLTLPTIPSPSYQRAADITVGYFDKDGHLDIIVDDFRGAGGGHLYVGNGDGTFEYKGLAYSRPVMGAYPFGVDSYDFDKDGKMDLTLSTYDTPPISPVFFQKGNGDGTFQAPIQISTTPFLSLGGVFPVTPTYIPRPVIKVSIDIKPGSYPNSINLGSKGVVPVAVLTTNSFDASIVDPSSVTFAGADPVRWAMEDVDGDGDMDMVFHFATADLAQELDENSTQATLTGSTYYGGQLIQGTDSVKVITKK